MIRSLLAVFALMVASTEAHALTTVYASSVYSTSGSVTNATRAVGAPNGSAARLQKSLLGATPTLILFFSQALSGRELTIYGAPPALAQVRIAIGDVVNGVATFAAQEVTLAAGQSVQMFDMSTQCQSVVGLNAGCNLVRVSVVGLFGTFNLDAVSGAPEPATWMMMIVAFGMAAFKLKRDRRKPALNHALIRR